MRAHVQQASVLSGRSVTFMGVVGLHALLIAALMLIKYVPPLIGNGPPPVDVIPIPPEVQPPPPDPLPQVADARPVQVPIVLFPPPDIVVPEDTIIAEANPVPQADTRPVQVDTGSGTGVVIAPPPARVQTALKYTAVRQPEDFYPPTSVTLQEQGVSIVNVCVGPNGKIDGVPTVEVSSGYKRLDQAAVKWAREALRFTPATDNGTAIRACKGFRVVFNLN